MTPYRTLSPELCAFSKAESSEVAGAFDAGVVDVGIARIAEAEIAWLVVGSEHRGRRIAAAVVREVVLL